MQQPTGQKRRAWFWVGVALLSTSTIWWLLLIYSVEDLGDVVVTGIVTTIVPIGIGVYGVWRGRKAITPTVSPDVQQGPRPALRFLLGFLILMLAVGGMIAVAVLLMTYVNESLGWVVMFMSIAFIPVLATKLRSSVQSIRQREEKRRDLERIEQHMRQKVLEEPGISHTGLCRSVEGNRDLKELAIAQLLDHGELKCEQRDRGRKYFVG